MTYREDVYEKMKGERLLAAYRDGDVFAFKTDGGLYGFTVEGDCCSTSFVESIDVSTGIVGAKIVGVEEATLESPPIGTDLSKYEHLECYNLRIITTLGDVVVDFRNDSNGYYGGNVKTYSISKRYLKKMEVLAEWNGEL